MNLVLTVRGTCRICQHEILASGPIGRHGCCAVCRSRYRCHGCDQVAADAIGHKCRLCRRGYAMFVAAMLALGTKECRTCHSDIEERIRRYARRAEAGLPLFDEDGAVAVAVR